MSRISSIQQSGLDHQVNVEPYLLLAVAFDYEGMRNVSVRFGFADEEYLANQVKIALHFMSSATQSR